MKSILPLVDRMLAGDRLALAKLITQIENGHPETMAVLARIRPRCGRGVRLGITGPPGAGKSTLVDTLIGRLRAAGHTVGVIAVDPSSPFSGGALLGDRIRMQSHYLDESVFIRSLSSRGSHGGLARATRNVARLLDAFGKDFILIETVGVGQTELDVMSVADTTIVVLVPEAGDTVQTMKAGLLEIADVFVVNKADRDGAMRIKTELEMMLQMRPPMAWTVPVLLTEAVSGKGVDELLQAALKHAAVSRERGGDDARAAAQREEFLQAIREEVARRVERNLDQARLGELLQQVRGGELDPHTAAVEALADEELIRLLLGSGSASGG